MKKPSILCNADPYTPGVRQMSDGERLYIPSESSRLFLKTVVVRGATRRGWEKRKQIGVCSKTVFECGILGRFEYAGISDDGWHVCLYDVIYGDGIFRRSRIDISPEGFTDLMNILESRRGGEST